MKLSNYLVLLVALVFLGGMTGCGKGNSAGGGDSSTSSTSSSSSVSNTGTPTNDGSYEGIISDIENGRFAAPKSSASEFVFDYYTSSTTSSSSFFSINCSGFSASWCDNNSSGNIGDYVFFRRMTSDTSIDARESKDASGLPTDLNSLRTHLASLARNALSYQKAYGYGFLGKVNGDNNTLVIRVGTSSEYQVYYIDLRYPLAAQPVRMETWKAGTFSSTLKKYARLRYEL